jgi:hypothetical protein
MMMIPTASMKNWSDKTMKTNTHNYPNMTQKYDHIKASGPIRPVTKSIKLYPDNPIHDCIDRIIEETILLDQDKSSKLFGLLRIQDLADELSNVCKYIRSGIMIKHELKSRTQKPN